MRWSSSLVLLHLASAVFGNLDSGYVTLNITDAEAENLYVDVAIGSPPQHVRAILDTGSSDFWVRSEKAACHGATYTCSVSSSFSGNRSSSFEPAGHSFQIKYDDTYCKGFWAKDTISIGGMVFEDMKFGVADETNATVPGVLGISYDSLQSVHGYSGAPNATYKTLPMALKEAGLIRKLAFSLNLDSKTPQIIFGGVDRSQYDDKLYAYPIVHTSDKPDSYFITLQEVAADGVPGSTHPKTCSRAAVPALLDSGTNGLLLPEEILENIAQNFHLEYNEKYDVYTSNYMPGPSAVISLSFGEVDIRVPLAALAIPGGDLPLDRNRTAFALTADRSNLPQAVLGVPFLRCAYVVFNPSDNVVALAPRLQTPSRTCPEAEKIQPIVSTIPGCEDSRARPWRPRSPRHRSTYMTSAAQPTTMTSRTIAPSSASNNGTYHAKLY